MRHSLRFLPGLVSVVAFLLGRGGRARLLMAMALLGCAPGMAAAGGGANETGFPRPLETYADAGSTAALGQLLRERVAAEPFNLVASAIFLLAILHTFFASKIRDLSHQVEERHAARLRAQGRKPANRDRDGDGRPDGEVSFLGSVLHFFGEVEAVFGLWVLALMAAITAFKGWGVAVDYVGHANFTEPMFVVVIMAIASTRPILRCAEAGLRAVASLGGGTPAAWWVSLLTLAPILGSFITEPAAMTIAALLLGRQFYATRPSARLSYATIGLLFVNISVGGTLTHFAAPPVLMVAAPWGWDTPYMLTHFGWKAALGIAVSTLLYFLVFRAELRALRPRPATSESANDTPVPAWVTLVQIAFLAFTVWQAHHPALFVGGFLFFLAFTEATAHHQSPVQLKSPLLVGFFLAGLVLHGGLQGWWIAPILGSLGEVPLFLGATLLTAFNDNAAITYLATLVPNLTEELKYAVVAGAVTGGGLTVIANAPNPAGQSILSRYFPEGVSPLGLAAAALLPTAIMGLCFMLL